MMTESRGKEREKIGIKMRRWEKKVQRERENKVP